MFVENFTFIVDNSWNFAYYGRGFYAHDCKKFVKPFGTRKGTSKITQ